MGRKRQFLVNHGDATASGIKRVTRSVRLAIEPHFAFIGLVHAGKYLHQRAFPGSVFADKRKDFAGMNDKINAM